MFFLKLIKLSNQGKRMRKFLSFALFGLAVYVSTECFIEINPHPAETSQYYIMQLQQIVTFEITAHKKFEGSYIVVNPDTQILWNFDRRTLEKVSSDSKSITLKAIRQGIGWVYATTIVRNNHCEKKIEIAIVK